MHTFALASLALAETQGRKGLTRHLHSPSAGGYSSYNPPLRAPARTRGPTCEATSRLCIPYRAPARSTESWRGGLSNTAMEHVAAPPPPPHPHWGRRAAALRSDISLLLEVDFGRSRSLLGLRWWGACPFPFHAVISGPALTCCRWLALARASTLDVVCNLLTTATRVSQANIKQSARPNAAETRQDAPTWHGPTGGQLEEACGVCSPYRDRTCELFDD